MRDSLADLPISVEAGLAGDRYLAGVAAGLGAVLSQTEASPPSTRERLPSHESCLGTRCLWNHQPGVQGADEQRGGGNEDSHILRSRSLTPV